MAVTVGGETVPAFVEAGVTYVRLADLLEEMGGCGGEKQYNTDP